MKLRDLLTYFALGISLALACVYVACVMGLGPSPIDWNRWP